MRRYKIGILGISECCWSGFGRLKTQTGETILYSGRDNEVHQSGVALALDKESAKCLECWAPISDCIISGRFYSWYIKTSIIQVYAPTNEAEVGANDDFYDQLQKVIDSVPKLDILVLTCMGDWNAKVRERQFGEEGVMGKEALKCVRNDNGERFVDFCTTNSLVVITTSFPHKDIHKYTWTSQDGRTRNQIDHVAVNSRFKRSVFETSSYRGADISSDDNLVVAVMQLKLCRVGKKASNTSKYECSKLKIPEVRQEFELELRNRFSCLDDNDHQTSADWDEGEEHTQPDLEQKWESFKLVFNESAKTVLGYKMKKSKSWITVDSWKKIEDKRAMKRMVDDAKGIEERRKPKVRQRSKVQSKER